VNDLGLGSWPARRARAAPHRTAVVDADGRHSYAELDERVRRLAHGLRGLGIERGERVAYLGANHHTFLETLFACGLLGAVFVPLNTRLAAPELEHCLADSGSAALIHGPPPPAPTPALRHTVAREAGRPGALRYEDLLAEATPTSFEETITLEDPFVIMYTSGTTDRPKGALLTHGNLTWNTVNVLVDVDLASDEVALCAAPLFHAAGLGMGCLPVLLKGGTVILEAAFDPDRALGLIETHRVTYMFGVPAMFAAIARARSWPAADLSGLRRIVCGGAPVPAAVSEAYLDRGVVFSQGYGMTEASPGVLLLPAEDAARKAGTAGVPHFFTEVRIADLRGRRVAAGRRGEVRVSGPNVMRGYWGRTGDTASALDDGWLRTGDIASADEEGYVSIVDRAKDMIVSGGENVSPAEVERELSAHPDVEDCAVIGVPDADWGEVGKAVVVPSREAHASGPELLRFLRTRLAGYKTPRSVVFAEALPRSPSGKLLKRVLRERYR
jgi:fatty-acyl-CoA synthase